jgi:hypothetical protein
MGLISEWIIKKEDVLWVELAQGRVQRQAFLKK